MKNEKREMKAEQVTRRARVRTTTYVEKPKTLAEAGRSIGSIGCTAAVRLYNR